MPSGRVHSFTTALLAGGLYYGAYRAGIPIGDCIALAGGCLAGILLTPDLDVNRGSISNYHARRLGGCVLGLAWGLLWKPYASIVPHRSIFSHAPIIGTVLRLGYLVMVYLLVVGLLGLTGIKVAGLPAWLPMAFTGLALADILHWILDNSIRSNQKWLKS